MKFRLQPSTNQKPKYMTGTEIKINAHIIQTIIEPCGIFYAISSDYIFGGFLSENDMERFIELNLIELIAK
jgi:hypothetical protein